MRALFIFFSVFCFSFAFGQSLDPKALDALERERVQAQEKADKLEAQRSSLRKDITGLQSSLQKTASETAQIERDARKIETRLQSLEQQAETYRAQIFDNRQDLTRLLGALQRIEARPPPAVLGSARDTVEFIETRHLVTGVTRSLQVQSDALKSKLQNLQDTEVLARDERQKLGQSEQKLVRKRQEIRNLVTEKSNLEKSVSTESARERQRAEALAAEAGSLRELIRSFESADRHVTPRLKPPKETAATRSASRAKPPSTGTSGGLRSRPVILPPDTKQFADARNSLRAPVAGRVSQSYGKDHKGYTVTSRPKAQVISPYAGRVEFAGPFKNYENVVIINVGSDYFILMTGLGEIYAQTGENILIGAPLGVMPSDSGSKPELYIELRKDGAPIDPKPWLGTAFAEADG